MDFEVLKEKLNQIHILNSVRLTIEIIIDK